MWNLFFFCGDRENMTGMKIYEIEPAPEASKRSEFISRSKSDRLEEMRQHALGVMHSLSQGRRTVPPVYMGWSDFVGEIEAELRKRLG